MITKYLAVFVFSFVAWSFVAAFEGVARSKKGQPTEQVNEEMAKTVKAFTTITGLILLGHYLWNL